MKTEKKCKGTGKAAGYGCGETVPVAKYQRSNLVYGLGISCGCYRGWLLNSEEGAKKIMSYCLKAKKEVKVSYNRKRRKEKDTIKDWKKECQTKVQLIARLIDRGLPCLARGNFPGVMNGGHVFARGGNTNFGMNLHNIHRQSAQSNEKQSDDVLMQENLVKEYGEGYLDYLRCLKGSPVVKYTDDDYHEFYKIGCGIANALRKAGQQFEVEDRIRMRNRFNFELGIYHPDISQFYID